MGIRFHEMFSQEVQDYDILASQKNGMAVVLGNYSSQKNQIHLFRFQKDPHHSLTVFNQTLHSFSYPQIKLRTKNDNLVVYLKSGRTVNKMSFNPDNALSQESEYISSSSIKSIKEHPSQNSLIVINNERIYNMENNYTIVWLGNVSTDSAQVYFQSIEGINTVLVAILSGNYLRLIKIQQEQYLSSYSIVKDKEMYVGPSYLLAPQIKYHSRHRFFRIPTHYHNIIFVDDDMEYIESENRYTDKTHVFSQDTDHIIVEEDYELFCSYSYQLKHNSIRLLQSTKYCIDFDTLYGGYSLSDQLFTIHHNSYPIIYHQLGAFKIYEWSLKQTILEDYLQGISNFVTSYPNSIIQTRYNVTTYKYDLAFYQIVPLSGLGIGFLSFGLILLLLMTTCVYIFIYHERVMAYFEGTARLREQRRQQEKREQEKREQEKREQEKRGQNSGGQNKATNNGIQI